MKFCQNVALTRMTFQARDACFSGIASLLFRHCIPELQGLPQMSCTKNPKSVAQLVLCINFVTQPSYAFGQIRTAVPLIKSQE